MNSKQIDYFLTLAKIGSFSAAAEKLSISQPSLSQYIKKLESDVGVELFIRNGQSVALTQAGEAFYRFARKTSELERNLTFELEDIRNECGGNIRIGISHFRCAGLMPRVISEFRKKYPSIRITLFEKTVAELVSDMQSSECDIYILPHEEDYPDFTSIDIAEEKFALTVPVRIAKQFSLPMPSKDEPLDIKMLDGADFVTLFEGQKAERELARLSESAGISVNVVTRCVDIETMYSLSLSSVGAALLPETVLDRRASDVRVYSVKGSKIRKIAAFLPKNAYFSKPMSELIEILKNNK